MKPPETVLEILSKSNKFTIVAVTNYCRSRAGNLDHPSGLPSPGPGIARKTDVPYAVMSREK